MSDRVRHMLVVVLLVAAASLVAAGCGEDDVTGTDATGTVTVSTDDTDDTGDTDSTDGDEERDEGSLEEADQAAEDIADIILEEAEGVDVEEAYEESGSFNDPLGLFEAVGDSYPEVEIGAPIAQLDDEPGIAMMAAPNTPGGKAVPSEETPYAVYFAVLGEDGECAGGWVEGYPELDTYEEYEFEEGEPCSVGPIDALLFEEYLETVE